jgi:leucyl aminopeptidase
MTTIRLSDGIVKDDVLVIGLAYKSAKSSKTGATSLQIETGDLAMDTKSLLQSCLLYTSDAADDIL